MIKATEEHLLGSRRVHRKNFYLENITEGFMAGIKFIYHVEFRCVETWLVDVKWVGEDGVFSGEKTAKANV